MLYVVITLHSWVWFYIDRCSSPRLDDIIDCLCFIAVFDFLTVQVWAEERDLIACAVEKCPGDTLIDASVCAGNISSNEKKWKKAMGFRTDRNA